MPTETNLKDAVGSQMFDLLRESGLTMDDAMEVAINVLAALLAAMRIVAGKDQQPAKGENDDN